MFPHINLTLLPNFFYHLSQLKVCVMFFFFLEYNVILSWELTRTLDKYNKVKMTN